MKVGLLYLLILGSLCWAQEAPPALLKTKQACPVYQSADESSQVLGQVPKESVLMAVKAIPGFFQIKNGERTGWVPVKAVSMNGPARDMMAAADPERFGKKKQKSTRKNRRAGNMGLTQCAHVHSNGQRCLYKTADDSGYCPEHQH